MNSERAEQYYVQVYGKGKLLPINEVLEDYRIPSRVNPSKLLYLSLAGRICTLITSDGNFHYNMNYPNGRWRTKEDETTRRLRVEEWRERKKSKSNYWIHDGSFGRYRNF